MLTARTPRSKAVPLVHKASNAARTGLRAPKLTSSTHYQQPQPARPCLPGPAHPAFPYPRHPVGSHRCLHSSQSAPGCRSLAAGSSPFADSISAGPAEWKSYASLRWLRVLDRWPSGCGQVDSKPQRRSHSSCRTGRFLVVGTRGGAAELVSTRPPVRD